MGARCGVASSWVSHMEWIVLDAEEGNFARSGVFLFAVLFALSLGKDVGALLTTVFLSVPARLKVKPRK